MENYTDAYAQFVELEFAKDILPNEEETLIGPLAKVWRDKKGQLNDLVSRLPKWLLPTYADEVTYNSENPSSPTMYYTQIRLVQAALSILSQRPECQFLSTLANCYANHRTQPQFNKNIGRLMRWGYTENVLDHLCSLADQTQSDEHLLRGLYDLANDLKQMNLPPQLRHPLSEENEKMRKSVEKWNSTFKPFIDRIRAQEKVIKKQVTNRKREWQLSWV